MLTKEEVKHIAKLARLALTEEEIEKFCKQLSAIVDHVKMLEEVNTEGVEPIAQITGLTGVFFADETQNEAMADALLKESPQKIQDRMIKVKNVFE